ncbi:hypothetical protein OHR68_20050 [Spirillospora sp. NBC_00431]
MELLQIETNDPASATPAPPVGVDGTALLVGPALLGRRQRIALTALVKDRPSLRCEAPLLNACVRRERVVKVPRVVIAAVSFVIGSLIATSSMWMFD